MLCAPSLGDGLYICLPFLVGMYLQVSCRLSFDKVGSLHSYVMH